MTRPGRDGEPPDEEPPDPDLPTSLVPRWLALVVLLALVASAGVSVCQVLDARGGPPAAARPSQAPPR